MNVFDCIVQKHTKAGVGPCANQFVCLDLTRFNKIATQGAPQMAYRESTLTILSLTCAYSMYSPP